MFSSMAADDTLIIIASFLSSYEAGMVRGLLESAGIPADVIDTVARNGGATVVVRATDGERAREIVQSSGAFPGPGTEEPVEIPEEEWSRTSPPENGCETGAPSARDQHGPGDDE
jgi:hypothetical protein